MRGPPCDPLTGRVRPLLAAKRLSELGPPGVRTPASTSPPPGHPCAPGPSGEGRGARTAPRPRALPRRLPPERRGARARPASRHEPEPTVRGPDGRLSPGRGRGGRAAQREPGLPAAGRGAGRGRLRAAPAAALRLLPQRVSAGAAGPGAGCGVRADPRAWAGTPGAEGRVRAGLDRSRGAGAGRAVCRGARARRPPRPQRVIRGLVRFFGAEVRCPPQGDPGSCASGMDWAGHSFKAAPLWLSRGGERSGTRGSRRCLGACLRALPAPALQGRAQVPRPPDGREAPRCAWEGAGVPWDTLFPTPGHQVKSGK